MTEKLFVDTNVLLYAVSTSAAERSKAAIARGILDNADLVLSVQVLQEFFVQATRAGRAARLTEEQAALMVESLLLRFQVQPMTVGILQAAIVTQRRFRISYWDAAIIEAARAQRCRTILSEDLNHAQDYGGVRVIDPFRGNGAP